MKVIKPGRPQKGWSHEFTCTGDGNGRGGCGAILLVEQEDLYEKSVARKPSPGLGPGCASGARLVL